MVKNTCSAYLIRVFFSYKINRFRFVKKFQVLFEISCQTGGANDNFWTQNWARIDVNKSK